MGSFKGNSYSYQIRSEAGTVGYVGQWQRQYVFTPLTYDEFPAAMLMAKALNKRTKYQHEVVTVKRRLRVNGRYGPMRKSAVAPVKADSFERPVPENEVPPQIQRSAFEDRDEVDPNHETYEPDGRADADYVEEYMRRISGQMPRSWPERRVGEKEIEVEICS